MDNSYPRKLVPRTSHNHDIFSWVRVDLGTSCLGYELSCVWVVRIRLKPDHLAFHKGHPHLRHNDAPRAVGHLVPILKEFVVSTTYNFPGFAVVMLLLSFCDVDMPYLLLVDGTSFHVLLTILCSISSYAMQTMSISDIFANESFF